MGKWSYEVEGWKGRHIKVNGLGWASIDDMFRAHNHDVEKMEKQIFDLAAQNAETQDENNRLDRELDEARKRIAELEAPTRVPFSDAHIERMAKAAYTARMRREEKSRCWDEIPLMSKDAWRQGIRAALAAGGLEPCAVPDYDPDDVALAPTGTVLCDGLVEAERKVENQRMSLRQMHEARERDARLIAELRAEVDEDNAAAASVNDLLVQVQNLTAERDAQEIELADLRFYQREFAAVSAERDALRERASVPQPSSNTGQLPPADQVEALARVLREASTGNKNNQPAAGIWIKEARAAIAHLNTRPEGLPTAEQLKAAHMQYAQDYEAGKNDGSLCASDFALDYLRPWLRDPVGFELDVTAEEMAMAYKDNVGGDGLLYGGLCAMLALCRSRIRPVYECKECAKLVAKIMKVNEIDGRPIVAEFNAAKDKAFEAQQALNEAVNEMGLGLRAALVARADIRAALDGE